MLIIASTNGAVGIDDAMSVLKDGGSAMDAVEIGIRLVEANPADHTVGYNGYPNILGQLELDASIMDGRTLNSGAVAIMRGFPYAISVARQVLDRKLPHVMLAGEGAERFAREIGADQWASMLSDEVKAIWRGRLIENSALLNVDAKEDGRASARCGHAGDGSRTRRWHGQLHRDRRKGRHLLRCQYQWLGLEIPRARRRFANHRRGQLCRQSTWRLCLHWHGRNGDPRLHGLRACLSFARGLAY